MAGYYVSESESDTYDDIERRFKFRHRSRDGHPVAQDKFNQLRNKGGFVRLLKWDKDEWKEMERANG